MKLAHCRSCEEPIVWAVTTNGKKMPVDADPVVAQRGFRLTDLRDDEPPIASFTTTPGDGERLYQSHFSTCPNADEHRR